MEFAGRTAIVTGGSRGIGRAICLELGRRGCDVAFSYRQSADMAERVAAELAGMGRRARAFCTDGADAAAVESMVGEVRRDFGRIDFLVNNAGITRDKLLPVMNEAEWDEVLNSNLKAAFHFCRAVVRIMLKARSGSILNITSISGIVGMAGQTNYAASKAGLIGFTKALAREVAGRNIRVNALALGFVETEMTAGLPQEHRARILEQIPMKRFAAPEEAAAVAAFILSDEARYMTGAVVQVDGGLAM
jgi:3-oxoacyl-[acyl-carrier protein] reductase